MKWRSGIHMHKGIDVWSRIMIFRRIALECAIRKALYVLFADMVPTIGPD